MEMLQGLFVTASITSRVESPRGGDDGLMTRLYPVEAYAMKVCHTCMLSRDFGYFVQAICEKMRKNRTEDCKSQAE